MVNQDKRTEKSGQLASKAAKVGGQAKERATVLAGEVAHRAAPLAGQARSKATELAHKAAPIAAHGVETTAQKLDQLTHGKYSDRIKAVSTSLEHLLDRGSRNGNGTASPRRTTATAPGATSELHTESAPTTSAPGAAGSVESGSAMPDVSAPGSGSAPKPDPSEGN